MEANFSLTLTQIRADEYNTCGNSIHVMCCKLQSQTKNLKVMNIIETPKEVGRKEGHDPLEVINLYSLKKIKTKEVINL
jgi:hypothetical protein